MAQRISIGTCETCGKPFTGWRSGQAERRFCSRACAYAGRSSGADARKAALAATRRVCARCEAAFTPASNRQKFCSATCRGSTETERKTAQRHARTFRCRRCQAEFHRDSDNYRQVYCSDTCRLADDRDGRSTFEYERKQSPEHIAKRSAAAQATLAAQTRLCVKCGAEFTPTSGAQRYCSGQCWNAAAKRLRKPDNRPKISPTEFQRRLAEQGGVCGICGEENGSGHRLAADHDHKTGLIRGLLCHRCNTAIGLFRDDPALLRAAIRYLRIHQEV